MVRNSRILAIAMAGLALAGTALAGSFATPLRIGGQAADLAPEAPRGARCVADFTRNSMGIVSLAANQAVNSIGVEPNPSSISRSPSGRWLLGRTVATTRCALLGTLALTW